MNFFKNIFPPFCKLVKGILLYDRLYKVIYAVVYSKKSIKCYFCKRFCIFFIICKPINSIISLRNTFCFLIKKKAIFIAFIFSVVSSIAFASICFKRYCCKVPYTPKPLLVIISKLPSFPRNPILRNNVVKIPRSVIFFPHV